MRIAMRLILVALLLYGSVCILMYVFQRSLIYFPQPGTPASASLLLPVEGAAVRVAVHPHAGPKALIYFGGNAEDVSASLPLFASAFPEYAIYALYYRGYGGSSGAPSERALHADALALFDKVASLDHTDIALVGRSLGSGVAVRLAGERRATRLVLVTPFDSLQDIAARHYPYFPVRWLLSDKFESWRYAPAIRVPTLLVQAEHDEIVPAASTERLRRAFAPGVASLVLIPGTGHNDISSTSRYVDALHSIL